MQSEMSLHIGPLLASSRRHKNSRMIFRYSRFCNQSTMRQGIICFSRGSAVGVLSGIVRVAGPSQRPIWGP
jgi:hypothetical protein